MSDWELNLVRSIAQRCLNRLGGFVLELEEMKVEGDVPGVVRYDLPNVIHDLQSMNRLLRRHVPAPPCGADSA